MSARRTATTAAKPVTLPIVDDDARFHVRRIYCVGRNYLDHIREMKEADERDPPFFFQKPTDAIVPNGAVVPYPAATGDFQFEVELVAAIGRGGIDISVESAESHILGYAIGLDLTRRDLQRDAAKRGLPWEMGKSFDYEHALSALFLCINPIYQLSIFIIVNHNMFRRRNKAMFDTTIAADLVLVSAGMKKSHIQAVLHFLIFGKKNFIDMFFGIIIIMTVTGNATKRYPLIFVHPIY